MARCYSEFGVDLQPLADLRVIASGSSGSSSSSGSATAIGIGRAQVYRVM
jgi:hypothetical protein